MREALMAIGITVAAVVVFFAFTMLLTYLSSVDETGWSAIAVFVVGLALFCVWFYRVCAGPRR